jgi:hypothetical protein
MLASATCQTVKCTERFSRTGYLCDVYCILFLLCFGKVLCLSNLLLFMFAVISEFSLLQLMNSVEFQQPGLLTLRD